MRTFICIGLTSKLFKLVGGSILYKKRIESMKNMKRIKVKSKTIAANLPVFIVAEMAWSHDGSLENARKIVKAAFDAEADAVKFHITSLEDYMVPHYGSGKGRVSAGKETRRIYDYLKSINLDRKAWQELFTYAKRLGLLICAMCNDLPKLE